MFVVKRNGTTEEVSFDKVLRRIKLLSKGLKNVNPTLVAQKVCGRIFDNVKTSELDELAARMCISMSTEIPDYRILASRLIISNNHKNTPDTFSECIEIVNKTGILDSKMVNFIRENKDVLDKEINNEKDYTYSWFSLKTLERAYLKRADGKIIERIQYMLMRVSCGIHYPNIDLIIQSYNMLSDKYFTHATPTLFNSGTIRPQMFSCFLTKPADSIDGIFKWISDLAKISKEAGGIGATVSCIRGEGSLIRGSGSNSSGIIPMLKVVNETMKYVNQGGRRAGSAAIYLEPHHPDIMKFLEIRLNTGNEDDRARDLFTAIWASDLFMERVRDNEDWSLFDPDKCKGLDDVYGDEYKKLYLKYEQEGKATKVVKAQDVWKKICKSQIETGTPYMCFKDACNSKSNQKHYGIIRASNLCAEILEYHDEKEYATCCLASLSLPKFITQDKKYDFDKLEKVAGQIVRNLNRAIDINLYPVPETKLSNFRHRPLGIGVQGLADVFAIMRYPYDSKEALQLNNLIFETIYYGCVKASMELSQKDGPYETFKGSPISKGLFQFDLWNVKPSDRYDWDKLRKQVIENGVRNSLLTALMPTASTSQILGNNEAFEPFTSNMYTRRTLSGDFIVSNKYMIKDLCDLGLWNKELKDQVIANNGSIQNINGIPDDIKKLYRTSWELKQKSLIDLSLGRGPYVCQTQSLNLFFEEPTVKILTSALFYGWKKGIKTGVYYVRSRPKTQAQQFTIDPKLIKNKKVQEKQRQSGKSNYTCTDDICYSCSG